MGREASAAKLTFLLTLGIVVMGSNSFVLSPILSDVANDLQTTPVILARVISVFGAATVVSSLLFSGMLDRHGERKILIGGAMVMCLCLIGCALSGTWYWMALFQGGIGLTVGVMLPACYATATQNAPEGEGARVLGRVISGWGIALVLGVPLSAFISDIAGWRVTFAALAFFAALAVAGFLQLPQKSTSIEITHATSIAAALQISGVMPVLGICLAFMTAFYGVYAFLGDHLRLSLGLTAGQAGIVVLGYGLGFAVASVVDGLVERIGAKKCLPLALVSAAAIYVLLIAATKNYPAAIATTMLLGFVNHICLNLIIFLLSRQDINARGVLMGLQTATTYTAVFAGPLLLGVLYSTGFDIVALVAALLVLIAATIAWCFKNAIRG